MDTVERNGDWRGKAATWLFGQEASVVLLFLILIALGWGGRHLIVNVIPTQLNEQKAEREGISRRCQEERAESRLQFTDCLKAMSDKIEKLDSRREIDSLRVEQQRTTDAVKDLKAALERTKG